MININDLLHYNQQKVPKTQITFVVDEEEISTDKDMMVETSAYIRKLTEGLDPQKNIRILLPKWMEKTSFMTFL